MVIDHSGELAPAIRQAAEAHNAKLSRRAQERASPGSSRRRPRPPRAEDWTTREALELSDRIRRGELDAYVEIPAGLIEPAAAGKQPAPIAYHSDNPNDDISATGWRA